MIATLQTRAIVAIAGVAVVVVAALALFGLPGGGSESSSSVTAVAEAAKRTASYPGARMTLDAQMEIPGSETGMTMEGAGIYNSAGRSRTTLTTTELPPEAAAQFPEGIEMEQVAELTPGTFVTYMRSNMFGELPDDAEWMKLDMSEETPDSASMDPRSTLRQLRSTSELETLGTEVVRGVETTHYRALVDQEAEIERLRSEGDDAAADALEQAIDATETSTFEMEVWVSERQVIRRFAIEMPFGPTMQNATMRMTSDLYDFGVNPEIELPDDEDAFDATEIAQSQIEAAAESD